MAERRMLSKAIVNSGKFCRMTDRAKILYVSLVVNADDEGAVDAFTPCLQCGTSISGKELLEIERNGYIIPLLDGVFFIVGWESFNRVQSSRLVKSDYHEMIGALSETCQQNVDNTLTQYSIGKFSVVEDSVGENGGASAAPASEKPKRGNFVKPSCNEVVDYFHEIGSGSDPMQFFDYYEANGWRAGKNKMRDWKAAARNWSRRDRGEPSFTTRPAQESTIDRIARLSREGKI